jgi:WD40 repeat protein
MENRDRHHVSAAGCKNPGRRMFLKLTGAAAAAAATTGLAGMLESGQPPAWNQELAAQTADPAVVGQWAAPVSLPVVAIHMHLLPNGNVLAWGKPETPPEPNFGVEAAVWDPTTVSPTFYGAHDPYVTIYCSGHSFLADGRLLATGGHLGDFIGSKVVSIFDFTTRTWSPGPDMFGARWYPTNTTLADGGVVVVSGTVTEGQVNRMPEVWNAAGGWRPLSRAKLSLPLYPWMHLAPNGKVFYAGPERTTRYLDTRGAGRWTTVAYTNFGDRHQYEGTSVMYEPGKVLIVGGGNPATASAEVINLNALTPRWRYTNAMLSRRRYPNATILPDGKVLVTGGSSSSAFSDPRGAVYNAETWDPATGFWSTMAAMSVSRLYHSTALLLPDGRVLLAGGGGDGAGGDVDHYSAEYYSPPFLFHGARPSISGAPETVGYGEAFAVGTPDGPAITQVTLVRLSSVTHEFNQNQRFNRLAFSTTSDGTGLSVVAPSDPNLCPPGHYMLFILNSAGVPSIATILRIG